MSHPPPSPISWTAWVDAPGCIIHLLTCLPRAWCLPDVPWALTGTSNEPSLQSAVRSRSSTGTPRMNGALHAPRCEQSLLSLPGRSSLCCIHFCFLGRKNLPSILLPFPLDPLRTVAMLPVRDQGLPLQCKESVVPPDWVHCFFDGALEATTTCSFAGLLEGPPMQWCHSVAISIRSH